MGTAELTLYLVVSSNLILKNFLDSLKNISISLASSQFYRELFSNQTKSWLKNCPNDIRSWIREILLIKSKQKCKYSLSTQILQWLEKFSSAQYTIEKRYNISFAWYTKYKYWFLSENGTVSWECNFGADGPRFDPKPLRNQNLGISVQCERIGKN